MFLSLVYKYDRGIQLKYSVVTAFFSFHHIVIYIDRVYSIDAYIFAHHK